jgi:hypothetical protein
MISDILRLTARLHCLTCLGLMTGLMLVVVTCVSAQGFEEWPVTPDAPARKTDATESRVLQPLPAIVSPKDVGVHRPTSGIIQPIGRADQGGGVVLAQYEDYQYQDDAEWPSSRATLPSIQLVQGEIPRVASIEKPVPQTSTYQGPGRIITGESDGMTPTITTRPSTHLPGLPASPRSQPAANQSGIVNAFSQSEEIEWDDSALQGGGAYEMLPKQLGYGSSYSSQDQYGMQDYGSMYGSQYAAPLTGGMYGEGLTGDGIAATSGYYGYGQGMYGYGYGGYPGVCPPSHGLVSGAFGCILGSNLWENLTIGVGGTSFKSPLEYKNGGAFGLTETLNWATPSTSMWPVRLQAGVRAIQAYPSGYHDDLDAWQRNAREQYFGTFGVFRRNIGCTPLSFGAVYDVMSDKYNDKYRLEQLRAELSYGSAYGVEFGYRGSFGLRNDTLQWRDRRVGVKVVDYHTLFVKKYFANGGEGSLAGGATEYGDWMFRAEYHIPLSNEWGLKNSLSYLVPRGGHSPAAPTRESWDVSLQLVYQPRGGMLAGFCNPFRTFFDVADNGTIMRRFK